MHFRPPDPKGMKWEPSTLPCDTCNDSPSKIQHFGGKEIEIGSAICTQQLNYKTGICRLLNAFV